MMAASRVVLALPPLLLLLGCGTLALAQVNVEDGASSSVPLKDVSGLLVQSALNSLNERLQPQGRAYASGDLISAQKLTQPPYVIYRLTLNLEPVCKNAEESCSREACTLVVRQHERGVIDVLHDSIRCMYLQPQSKQQPQEQQSQPSTQDQEVIENIEKQIINQSISLDHEVQTSADHNDRPFIAVRASQSEYCPGCPYELNPSLPGLSAFGNQVMRSMDEAGVSDFKHKLISIVRVTRAVPPGSNLVQYQLLMEIGESSCLRTSLIEIAECPLQSNLPIELCLVTLEERLWQTGSRRITKNNCTDSLSTDNEVSASVDPSSLLFESASPYKEEDASARTEFYDQIAQEAQEVFRVPGMDASTRDSVLTTQETDPAKDLPHSKVVLDRVKESQQPAKFADKMKEFDEFLEDFNIPIRTETTSPRYTGVPVTEEPIKAERVEDRATEPPEQPEDAGKDALERSASLAQSPSVESVRSKRSSTKALENNKPMLRKLALRAVELLDELDEDHKRKHLIDVLESERERQDYGVVVYYLSVEVAATDCSEGDRDTECLDEVLPGPTQICKLDVSTNEKKPLLAPKLLHYECRNKQKPEGRFKRQLVGAPETHSPEDPEVQRFVQLGLKQYSQNLAATNEPIVSAVKEVSVQVVSGLLYKIKTDIGVSTCAKGVTENCQLKAEEGVKECVIEAWSQPWMDNGNPKITVKCDQGARRRRSLRGQNYSQKMLQQSRELKEEKLFHEFVGKFKKKYASTEEKERRFEIFKDNLDMIEELQRNEQGTGRYGVTQFTDLTKAEFKAKYLGLKPSLKSDNDIPMPMAEIPDVELPAEFDWRHHNAVTPVKDQGQCGSCWAFSVTGNIEGQYAIKHGQLLSLSEQELVDCDKLDDGCNGGLPDTAYRAIEELGGLETETDYPYDAEDEKCHFNKSKVKVNVVSGLNITSNETQMAQWLVKNGPMSIGINANAMQFYFGGVSHPFHFLCSPDSLDHGVLIVGYGTKSYPIFKKTMPYWLIKNSWGPRWGEQGYYRVYRGDGTCGVNQMVTSAVVV